MRRAAIAKLARTPASRRRRIARGVALALTTAAVAGAGVAWGYELPSQVSANWAGWVVTAGGQRGRLDRHFTSVSASWVQPSATCTSGKRTFAAFWVGLGGYATRSKALEQIGTEADCSSRGQLFYYAWYEFVPRPPVTIRRLRIRPGDAITARVHAISQTVTVSLSDATSGGRPFRSALVMHSPTPDTSAAEWIAEAPSNCIGTDSCTPLHLTNFGQITFSAATASSIGSDGRHSGPICDPAWRQYGMIVLQAGRSAARSGVPALARPTELTADGRSFSVAYGATASTGVSALCSPTAVTGPTGASGLSGPTGTSGLSGPTGTSGLSGPTGTSGPTGVTGSTGSSGVTGPTGASGATG
jgi:Peptidase A4 family/Collagen triple helix repeat (20 copies)